ncbi:hypothetical protein EI71_00116 [Anaeroplasma bactoclasticum]|jgi:hypothetical protein|uniref:Uncharacterized protein n=1 Tax=Anaeroplasma bactoclasticum TaxID=2088 RepID=A0A397S2E6_9MOLU|nr:hypothetical protein [Anaeroplasma bactoclasticum]RIA78555.1 hypothetical protein EI71_00116 [Anaeroplasma bactoclasticum]
MGLFDRFKKKKEDVQEEAPVIETYNYVEGCETYVTDQGFLVLIPEVKPPFQVLIVDNGEHKQILVENMNNHKNIDFGDIKTSYSKIEDGVYTFGLLPEEARRQKMEFNRRITDREHPPIAGTYDVSKQLEG